MIVTIEEIFCLMDDSCEFYKLEHSDYLSSDGKKRCYRAIQLIHSEIITLLFVKVKN